MLATKIVPDIEPRHHSFAFGNGSILQPDYNCGRFNNENQAMKRLRVKIGFLIFYKFNKSNKRIPNKCENIIDNKEVTFMRTQLRNHVRPFSTCLTSISYTW